LPRCFKASITSSTSYRRTRSLMRTTGIRPSVEGAADGRAPILMLERDERVGGELAVIFDSDV
jgi:hypothetical protein